VTVDKRALVASLSDQLILDLTARLVAIPTRNPPGEEKPAAELIHATLTGWGIEAELVDKPDPERPQVIAWLRGTGEGPTFILNGHIDTVVEGDPAHWTRPPFEATREDDRLYGLGTSDMKGAIASCMAILKSLHDSGARFPGTLMFQAVMGEEMDEPGTKTLLELGYTGDWAITMEPTDARIGPGTRGACWHRIEITGPSSHCGLVAPDAPDVMHFVSRFAHEVELYHSQVSRQPHHLLASPACRITKVEAGETHNSTARRCMLLVDRRMLPHESTEQVGQDLRERLDKVQAELPAIDYSMEFIALNEATEIPLDSPLVTTLAENYKEVRGVEAEIWGPPYGSDMRNFVVDAGIPTVNFGAGDFHRCHQPDEFVPVDDLLDVARVVYATVIDFLQGKAPRG